MRVVGKAKRGQIELRYQEDIRYPGQEHLDEVCAHGATVHLEQMSDQSFALIIYGKRENACIMIGTNRAPVSAWEYWREPQKIGRATKATKAKRALTTRRSEAHK